MLCVQSRIPVDLGKVKGEAAIGLALVGNVSVGKCAEHGQSAYVLDNVVRIACQQLHLEEAELCVDAVELVYNSPDPGVFLFQ